MFMVNGLGPGLVHAVLEPIPGFRVSTVRDEY